MSDDFESRTQSNWPQVINALLRRFLTDDVLQAAFDSVSRATQGEKEDEGSFAERISKSSRQCRHEFTRIDLVNYYVRGLHPATREGVSQQLRMLSETQSQDLSVVRQIALSVGKGHRALLQSSRPTSSVPPSPRDRKAKPALFVGSGYETQLPPQPSFIPQYPSKDTESFNKFAEVALNLDSILFVKEGDPAKGDSTSPLVQKITGTDTSRPVLRDTEQVPDLSEEQLRLAFSVIPSDYWTLNCWTCRDEGHSTFTCTYLTSQQRVFFAYRYYLHQIEANPHMAEYLKEVYDRRQSRLNTSAGGFNRYPPTGRGRGRKEWRGMGGLP